MQSTPLKSLVCAALAAVMLIMPTLGRGQELNGPPANPQYKYSTETPPGVEVPHTLDTRIGTLHFFDGLPGKASTEKL